MTINLENNKYTINITNDGKIEVLRYDEPWRDCTGDKLILALIHEVDYWRGISERITPSNY
jgi:hypothetical protein